MLGLAVSTIAATAAQMHTISQLPPEQRARVLEEIRQRPVAPPAPQTPSQQAGAGGFLLGMLFGSLFL